MDIQKETRMSLIHRVARGIHFFAKNKEAHAMDWALIKDRNNWHNLQLNSKQARFYGISYEVLPYLKEKIKDLIMNRIRFPCF